MSIILNMSLRFRTFYNKKESMTNDLNNGAAAGGSFFSVTYEIARSGYETLLINGKYIHSKFKPETDSENIVFPGTCIIAIYGLGLAYHVNNIAISNPDSIIIVYEPLLDVFNHTKELLKQFPAGKNVFIINNFDTNYILDLLDSVFPYSFLRLKTYTHIGYRNINTECETIFFENISKAYKTIVQNIMTEANFIPLWFKNTVYNFSFLKKSSIVTITHSCNQDDIAVICGAGPTLDDSISFLRYYREKLTIFATDTALLPLSEAGIVPDVVVCLDGQQWSIEDFVTQFSSDTVFLFDILGLPAIQHYNENIVYTSHSYKKNSFQDWMFKSINCKSGLINTGGTVTDYCLDIAVKAGFKNIVFAGYDMSFPGNKTHARGTPYHKRVVNNSNYFLTISDQFLKSISQRNPVYEKNNSGKLLFTDFVMSNYRSYLENYIAMFKDIHFYSASDEAVRIEGGTYINPDDFFSSVSSVKRVMCYEKIAINSGDISILFEKLSASLFIYSTKLSDILNSINWDSLTNELLASINSLMDEIFTLYPFLNSFNIMTDIILDGKGIDCLSVLYAKHKSFRLLQSIYFVIRTLQKAANR
ncbi:MAG: hypothetical protein A2355_01330 [Spirochaetes bacterium RIFOXYB1_FULL_32_8]|nr:MAG: hypothetical protein A2355_01330 [Spirochaetes bacterium RIFOXYB1_FULL_32_8]